MHVRRGEVICGYILERAVNLQPGAPRASPGFQDHFSEFSVALTSNNFTQWFLVDIAELSLAVHIHTAADHVSGGEDAGFMINFAADQGGLFIFHHLVPDLRADVPDFRGEKHGSAGRVGELPVDGDVILARQFISHQQFRIGIVPLEKDILPDDIGFCLSHSFFDMRQAGHVSEDLVEVTPDAIFFVGLRRGAVDGEGQGINQRFCYDTFPPSGRKNHAVGVNADPSLWRQTPRQAQYLDQIGVLEGFPVVV